MNLKRILSQPIQITASPANEQKKKPEPKITKVAVTVEHSVTKPLPKTVVIPVREDSQSTKPIVAVTWPIDQDILEKLRARYEVRLNSEPRSLSEAELKQFVVEADAILCLLTNKITAQIITTAGPQLKIIATMSVGVDHIDLSACQQNGVIVTNTPGASDSAVAEHTIALMLAVTKQLPQADRFVREGKYRGWDPQLFVGPELKDKVLGIVGLGHVGSHVAQIARFGFGMHIVYTDRKPNPQFGAKYHAKFQKLEALLKASDVVTLHVPLVPSTHHLINASRLALMKPEAILINTSRGPVVDERALAQALASGRLSGAGLDVYEHEPLVQPQLLQLDRVVLSPHTASATHEARRAMALIAVENILTVLTGKQPLNAVKTEG